MWMEAKRVRVAILTTYKIDLKSKAVNKDKKRVLYSDKIINSSRLYTIINRYVLSIGEPTYIKTFINRYVSQNK